HGDRAPSGASHRAGYTTLRGTTGGAAAGAEGDSGGSEQRARPRLPDQQRAAQRGTTAVERTPGSQRSPVVHLDALVRLLPVPSVSDGCSGRLRQVEPDSLIDRVP